jgi:hypothetical protein
MQDTGDSYKILERKPEGRNHLEELEVDGRMKPNWS